MSSRKSTPNRGSFRPVSVTGLDNRRHQFSPEERSRGGRTTARRYLCLGRWYLDWLDRCDRRTRNDEGEYTDGTQEDD